MKKLIFMIAAMLLMGASAFAQPLLVQDKDFEKFLSLNVESDFIVKLVKSDSYAVKLTTDERIAAHVQAFVKNGTLYLILDEKGYTPELKKQLRQKGAAAPVLQAEVYMPTLNSLIMNGKSQLVHCDSFYNENFTATLSGNAVAAQLNVGCSTAELNVSKGAKVTAALAVESKVYLNASNSATVSLTQNGGNAFLKLGGSSLVDMRAEAQSVEVEASSSAESHVSGVASMLKVTAVGLSRTDTELLETKDGDVTLSGSAKCHVNVTDNLKVNLTGGSMLTFKRKPSIEVDRIVNSTLIKADDPKRK
ncbi:MAG: DUF2807 domain-containing protein [Bacteroidales bacterium]|nr:DUF2807 domain-containing protein [Bacteroidales bacterium]MBQ2919297.1 DUF2807 domain-containing protein [Bacteroidales bacterium]